LAGCASNTTKDTGTRPESTPDIVNHISHYIGDYEYIGIKHYGDDLGYSLRYNNKFLTSTHADFYIWPVPPQATGYPHKDIVFAASDASLSDIIAVKENGGYQEMEILDQATYDSNGLIITVHKFSFLRSGLRVVSFMYVTEHKGSFLKARVSMPDNEANRDEKKVNVFVTDVLNQIIANIDRV